MSKRLLIIILIVSLCINLVAIFTLGYYWLEAHRFERGFMPPPIAQRHDWQRSHLRERLDLTEEQVQALNEAQEELKAKIHPIMEELFSKREELLSLLRESDYDSERADNLIREIVSLQVETETHIFDNLWHMKNILSQEQQERFFEMMEERHEYMGRMPPFGDIKIQERLKRP